MSQTTVPTKTPAKNSLIQSQNLVQLLGVDAVQILKCGICLEFFDLPIVLPCGHTFCLHCLTEMCRHASRSSSNASLQDVRIGCPNCRILIYASPVLERNVTCNFIVQSLIELLKAREDRQTQDKGANTDEVRIGSKIRTPSDSDVARVMNDLDRMTEALGRRNVVDHAYFEIDQIRREHLAREDCCKHVEAERPKRPNYTQPPGDVSSTTKPRRQFNPRPPLYNANLTGHAPYAPASPFTGSGCAGIPKPQAFPTNPGHIKNAFCPPTSYGGLPAHLAPVPAQPGLQKRQQQHLHHHQQQQLQQLQQHQQQQKQQQQHQQQSFPGLMTEKQWPEHHLSFNGYTHHAIGPPVPSSASTAPTSKTMTHVSVAGLGHQSAILHQLSSQLGQTSLQQQQQQMMMMRQDSSSALPGRTADSRLAAAIKNIAAATSASKSSPDVVGHGNNGSNLKRKPSFPEQAAPICSNGLDNDPAVMSYSCNTNTVCPVGNQNHT